MPAAKSQMMLVPRTSRSAQAVLQRQIEQSALTTTEQRIVGALSLHDELRRFVSSLRGEMVHSQRVFTTMDEVREIVLVLESMRLACAVIGAVAGAAHHYVRATADIDIAVNVPLHQLYEVKRRIEAMGAYTNVELFEPDEADALGGVVRAERVDDGLKSLDVVNFYNPFRSNPPIGYHAIKQAVILAGVPIVDLAHLIALKLYANVSGGKQMQDVIALLEHNPNADRDHIRSVCEEFGLVDASVGALFASR